MTTTQDKFLAKLETLAENAGLELIVDKSYANVGTASFQHTESFEPVFELGYNFQSGYGSFSKGVQRPFVKLEELDEVLALVRKEIG